MLFMGTESQQRQYRANLALTHKSDVLQFDHTVLVPVFQKHILQHVLRVPEIFNR